MTAILNARTVSCLLGVGQARVVFIPKVKNNGRFQGYPLAIGTWRLREPDIQQSQEAPSSALAPSSKARSP